MNTNTTAKAVTADVVDPSATMQPPPSANAARRKGAVSQRGDAHHERATAVVVPPPPVAVIAPQPPAVHANPQHVTVADMLPSAQAAPPPEEDMVDATLPLDMAEEPAAAVQVAVADEIRVQPSEVMEHDRDTAMMDAPSGIVPLPPAVVPAPPAPAAAAAPAVVTTAVTDGRTHTTQMPPPQSPVRTVHALPGGAPPIETGARVPQLAVPKPPAVMHRSSADTPDAAAQLLPAREMPRGSSPSPQESPRAVAATMPSASVPAVDESMFPPGISSQIMSMEMVAVPPADALALVPQADPQAIGQSLATSMHALQSLDQVCYAPSICIHAAISARSLCATLCLSLCCLRSRRRSSLPSGCSTRCAANRSARRW